MIFQTRLDKYRNNSQYNSHSHLTKAQKISCQVTCNPAKIFHCFIMIIKENKYCSSKCQNAHSRFVETINEKWDQYYVETNLKRLRMLSGLSQSELAKRSGVALRQIQLFEQRQRDINHTRAIDVLSLAREIGCKSEELLEI